VNTLDPEGATLLASVKAVSAQTAIVVFSGPRGQDALSHARLYGAAGYVLKTAETEELVEAIHAVAAGSEHFRF
jgi:DNA-binding NarL/FixJ family response regulator